jgi:ribonuclease J
MTDSILTPQGAKKTSISSPAPTGDYVRIIPLGGLDEVGMNCCLIECNGSMIMLDCGLTFPETQGFGVDIILPDWAYVLDNLDMLEGIVITHGHEDHIGALPFFLGEVDVPVWGGLFTLGMIERKLEEHDLLGEVDLNPVRPGDTIQIGPFSIEFIHTNHSIPNSMSVSLVTPLGRIIFTGDWKLDQTPIGEPPMDLQRFAELGRAGTLALLADSTNSGTPGWSESERRVQAGLADVLDTATGRVFVAQFGSNIHRVQGMLEIASQFNRKVVLMGRSLVTNFQLAQKLGFIKVPDGKVLIDAADMQRYPHDELLIITTGSQAEPRSGLTRMAYGDHSQITIRATDTIVMSARVIPGNELGIDKLLNQLAKIGTTIITQRDAPIHASGHAKQEEMKLLLNLVRPQILVPMHGTFRMRKTHAELGRAVGIPEAAVIEDGDVLQFTKKDGKVQQEIIDRVHAGRIFVDGRSGGGGDIEDLQLRDRRQLAQSGLVILFAVVDRHRGELTRDPEILQRGALNDDDQALLVEAATAARRAFDSLSPDQRRSISEIADAMRVALRRFFKRKNDKKPVIIPIIHES